MKTLFVVGSFDDAGGHKSFFGREFITECLSQGHFEDNDIYNGGKFEDLERIVFSDYSTIFWFANVANGKPKLVREIKKNNPKCMLVTSKRNDNGEYGPLGLVASALQTKSNLLVEFKKSPGQLLWSVIDPLGNCFASSTWNTNLLVTTVLHRLEALRGFTRQPSLRIGEELLFPENDQTMKFINLVQNYAHEFHELMQAKTERFIGNASFRCESGFPSFRDKRTIFVSKRNIDKCEIDQSGFVAARRAADHVMYYGDNKPSVDTPVQLALYDIFPRINFMLHSHAYVKDAPRTSKVIPCGASQEIDEILSIVPSTTCNWFFINLLGHGSICAAENPQMLTEIAYIARPLPEMFNE